MLDVWRTQKQEAHGSHCSPAIFYCCSQIEKNPTKCDKESWHLNLWFRWAKRTYLKYIYLNFTTCWCMSFQPINFYSGPCGSYSVSTWTLIDGCFLKINVEKFSKLCLNIIPPQILFIYILESNCNKCFIYTYKYNV